MLKSLPLPVIVLSMVSTLANAQSPKSITDAKTVLAIYTNDRGLGSTGEAQLIVCIWGDGTIVWSNDQLKGGSPYFTASLNPDDVSETFQKLNNVGVFDVSGLKQANFGPDSQFTSLLVRIDGRELKMDSWHELWESKGNAIASEGGQSILNGKKLIPALAEQSADYLHYRMTWLELRLAAANLIPKTGDKTAGVPQMLRGRLSWQLTGTETSDK